MRKAAAGVCDPGALDEKPASQRPATVLLRSAILAVLITLGVLTATAAEAQVADAQPSMLSVYIGTYTNGESEGIYLCELDQTSGALTLKGLAGKVDNPSFLAVHPDGGFLYAVSEVDDYAATGGGAVSAFAVKPDDGLLTPLNHQPSGGRGPCHVSLDRNAKNVLVANYGSGSASVIPIAEDGTLKAPSVTVQHHTPNYRDLPAHLHNARQKQPHAHAIHTSPDNRFAFVTDLGRNSIVIYQFDEVAGALHNSRAAVKSAAGWIVAERGPEKRLSSGSGPRHFAFHPTGKFAYVINELSSTVTPFCYDAETGMLTDLRTITTLPTDFKGDNTTAEIQVHPNGKFLYGSNRGHDSIAMFAIEPKTGKLKSLGQHSSGGKTPRNFGIDPSGSFLLAAHQDSNTVVVHRIDAVTGGLIEAGYRVDIPSPVCVKFAP